MKFGIHNSCRLDGPDPAEARCAHSPNVASSPRQKDPVHAGESSQIRATRMIAECAQLKTWVTMLRPEPAKPNRW
jgi:hypothetical protein